MAAITRTATGTWRGSLKEGDGTMDAPSGVLAGTRYSFATRFGDAKGTNPEELIGAAHAACYSMAFANYLTENGHQPTEIRTEATVTMENMAITKVHLSTRGKVEGMANEDFIKHAEEAEKRCPVSNVLRPGLTEITLDAQLA